MKGKGFTLIELMVVVLIVAVLAAILAPMLMARLEAARWAEGKAGCGTLATAIRATFAEYGEESMPTPITDPRTYLRESDLQGKYFTIDDYTITNISVNLDPTATDPYPLHYTISVGVPAGTPAATKASWTKGGYSLDHTGEWTELGTGG